MKKKEVFYPYGIVVWTLSMLFFLYEFFIRVLPATISSTIISDLNIKLDQFALISSGYYITYACMQIPVGILVDRFGARALTATACVICTVGMVGFAFSENYFNAMINRLLIGFGSSFGFITLLVLTHNWFPHRHFGFLSGMGQALGAIGPLIAGAPAIWMMSLVDNNWRHLFLYIAIFGTILSVLIAFFVRNKPSRSASQIVFIKKRKSLKSDLIKLLKIPQVWVTMFYSGFIYVSLPLLAAYWGVFYLQSRNFDKATAGLMISMIWVGLSVGNPIFGRISDQIKRRKPVLTFLSFVGFLAAVGFLFFPTNSAVILGCFLFLMGLANSGESLSFAYISEHVPSDLKATAMGANNTAMTICAAVLPPLATIVIQSQIGDRTILQESDFTTGFLLMPIAYGISGLVSLFLVRETFCRPQHMIHHL